MMRIESRRQQTKSEVSPSNSNGIDHILLDESAVWAFAKYLEIKAQGDDDLELLDMQPPPLWFFFVSLRFEPEEYGVLLKRFEDKPEKVMRVCIQKGREVMAKLAEREGERV